MQFVQFGQALQLTLAATVGRRPLVTQGEVIAVVEGDLEPSPGLLHDLARVERGAKSRALRLHHKPYSIVSYAWGQRYQQSNQWVIETVAQGVEPGIANRVQAQAWLQFKGYQPTTVRLGPLTRLGARASAANVAFDDHPDAKRFSDRIATVTVDSVFGWLQRSSLSAAPTVVRL